MAEPRSALGAMDELALEGALRDLGREELALRAIQEMIALEELRGSRGA